MRRFYFHRSCSHDFVRCGHVKRHKKEAKFSLRNMDDDVLTATSEILAKHCPTTLANQFLQLLTGGRLSTGSINSMRNHALVRKHVTNPDETTAETLIRMLKSNDDIEFVSYAASCNEALDLVKVRKQRKNLKNMTEQDVDSVPGDTKSFVKSVINGLQLKEGSMLIAIVWVSKIARHCHHLCPQVLGGMLRRGLIQRNAHW